MTQQQINVDLFDQVKKLQHENARLKERDGMQKSITRQRIEAMKDHCRRVNPTWAWLMREVLEIIDPQSDVEQKKENRNTSPDHVAESDILEIAPNESCTVTGKLERKLESSAKALDEIARMESDSNGDPWATLEAIGAIARNTDYRYDATKDCDCDKSREASTYEHAGCTASAMGWAIKYSNIQELALRLINAKGRFHTQRAFQDLREFILEEKAHQKTNE
jgi:hypothetical protein